VQAKLKSRADDEQKGRMFAGHVGQRLREAGMLLSFALAGYFLLAMFSYDALDPSWSHSGSNSDVLPVRLPGLPVADNADL
jgi:hypothetical protein